METPKSDAEIAEEIKHGVEQFNLVLRCAHVAGLKVAVSLDSQSSRGADPQQFTVSIARPL